jgi:hypothetical protein
MVIGIAIGFGWKYYHPPDNIPNRAGNRQTVIAGFPDLTLVRDERLVFVELKRNKARATVPQIKWLEALSATGAETYVWKPKDLSEVTTILK